MVGWMDAQLCYTLAPLENMPQVSVARPSSKEIKNSKLYVTNLPDHFNQENVVEVFQQVCGFDMRACRGSSLLSRASLTCTQR